MVVFGRKVAKAGGEAIVISQVERIASRYKSSVPVYNEAAGTMTLTIEVKDDERKAYVNGRYLKTGKYTIWYENEKTILRKLDLMNEYGLKGAGLWALDNEYAEFWEYYEKGFFNTWYESEESVKERAYYEEVERLIREVEPLKLEGELIVFENNDGESGNDKLYELDTNYLIQKKLTIGSEDRYSNKVIMIQKHLKKLNKFSIVHNVKRYVQK